MLQATMNLTEVHAQNAEALKVIYSSLVILSKVFYSLNFQVSNISNDILLRDMVLTRIKYMYFIFRIYQNFLRITWLLG